MPDPEAEITAFLESSGWNAAERRVLAGDASHRRYERVFKDGKTAVLMIAPPEKGESTGPFLSIADYLLKSGLSAPRVYAADTHTGLVLLEDLGDDLFARLCERHAIPEVELYTAAVDLLVALQSGPYPDELPIYGAAEMAKVTEVAPIWYGGLKSGNDRIVSFSAKIEPILASIAPESPVVVLRDYHAENLLWLPDRSGFARVGLLDFQDAALGFPGYDLVSLLDDARRDVAPRLVEQMVERYTAATGRTSEAFATELAYLGLQRNLRILGVFARLCLRDGKPGYVDLIPRVWRYVQNALRHPGLEGLRPLIDATLPEPTAKHLASLKAACGTHPQPS
ncbi:MAG: phosphotransferase [Rhodobacteraceae bacterium]|nr:phosphotransferase [Alphaproteobacteria bacterium]MBT8474933.1 phosphotransferase [Alphaproteobacteria bacterium]NNK68101.1 phosphotransferase [Paracoccaceae bacterium]